MFSARPVSWLLLIAAALGLGACAETELAVHAAKEIARQAPAEGRGIYKVGQPYQIDGVWYYPKEDYAYVQTGIASWYGEPFHGKPTANGEIYDMNAVSAAHRTLPMPSLVRVTNLENGRAVVVRINDRGPFNRGRIIDLSRRAAQLLGFEQIGTAKVRVEILAEESRALAMAARQSMPAEDERVVVAAAPRIAVTSEPLAPPPGFEAQPGRIDASPPASARPPPATAGEATAAPLAAGDMSFELIQPTNIFVQAGAFIQFDNANRLRARLAGLGPTRITQVDIDGQPFFRVRLGPIASVDEADALLDLVVGAGYPGAQIVVD